MHGDTTGLHPRGMPWAFFMLGAVLVIAGRGWFLRRFWDGRGRCPGRNPYRGEQW
jgi:hypothetical protein